MKFYYCYFCEKKKKKKKTELENQIKDIAFLSILIKKLLIQQSEI